MKRYKRILILVGVLVLCCIAAFAVTKIEEQKEQIRNAEEVILSLPEADIRTVSWETAETALAFHRTEEGKWKWDEDDAFPVDDAVMADMLGIFAEFSSVFAIEDVSDYSQYGLDAPEGTICLTTADASYTVTMGTFSTLDAQRYVSIGDGNVYLVSTDPMDTYGVELSDLIDHDELAVYTIANTVTFTGSEGYTLTYKTEAGLSYCGEDVYFYGDAPLDTENVDTYLHNLTYMSLTDYVSYNATEQELADCGLDAPALSVRVDYTVENADESLTVGSYTVSIGVVTEEAEEEGAELTTTAYARVGDSPIIYRLAEDDEAAVLAYTYDDLRHGQMFTADFETVTSMEITMDGQTYALTKTDAAGEDSQEASEQPLWMYAETEIDAAQIQSALTELTADSFADGAVGEQEEIRMVLQLDSEYSSQMEIVLYRFDGALCLCEVNGRSVALVSRSSVVTLMEAIRAIVL